MKLTSFLRDVYGVLKSHFYLISWISLISYLFYDTCVFYQTKRQFYHLRRILGTGLCISRSAATVINISCALLLLPLCKKLNHILHLALSKIWPRLFFLWLENSKSFHMTVSMTLLIFAVIHSIAHVVNIWNFSRFYDEGFKEINFASYKNESPVRLMMSLVGVSGLLMMIIVLSMALTSLRVVRRNVYNIFWYTHRLYFPFMVLLVIHPLSGVLKEELINDGSEDSNLLDWTVGFSVKTPTFVSIPSKTWRWMLVPLSCFLIDFSWRVFGRNWMFAEILEVNYMQGRTMSVTIRWPWDQYNVRFGQYIFLQCLDISLFEWHPFSVVEIPTPSKNYFVVWIKVKGDWTEAFEKLLLERGFQNISVLVDGPYPSPMEGVSVCNKAICVAVGVGITPFVATLHSMFLHPRSRFPHRLHLLWIVRNKREISWIADLVTNTLIQLIRANRPDRLQLEIYVTRPEVDITNKQILSHTVVVNETGKYKNIINRNDKIEEDNIIFLTPKRKRVNDLNEVIENTNDFNYDVNKKYPLLGCRVRRGRPHWDRVFGYWVHLYPQDQLEFYCCGPKKLVKSLKKRCEKTSRYTTTKFQFIHEAF